MWFSFLLILITLLTKLDFLASEVALLASKVNFLASKMALLASKVDLLAYKMVLLTSKMVLLAYKVHLSGLTGKKCDINALFYLLHDRIATF